MLQGLNAGQREAVTTLNGPVLVLAGAGTGKTRVITYRIANLIAHGTAPDRILAVTFTNKAAREMRDRAIALFGKRIDSPPLISTFHSLCVNILRQEIEVLGYSRQFTIHDRGEQESVARAALRALQIAGDALAPRDLLVCIGKWKSAGVEPRMASLMALDPRETLAAQAYKVYQQSLVDANAVDFDDLLMLVDRLFRDHAAVADRQAARWDRILVDEYQDTSGNQYRIVKRLADRHQNLCVVGDDDQSIYGWRGAEIRNILEFQRDFPKAKVVRLEENYRCCPNVVKVANDLIRWNPGRHEKQLRATRPSLDVPRFEKYPDEIEEARAVAGDIRRTAAAQKLPWSSFAILGRTNEQARPFEGELRALGIPYVVVGGLSFFDRREIRDVIAYLRVVANPADEPSLERILNVPPRGVGEAVRERLIKRAVERRSHLWAILPDAIAENALPTSALAGLHKLVQVVESIRHRHGLTKPDSPATGVNEQRDLVGLAREVLEAVDYRKELGRQYPNGPDFEARWAAVGELLNSIGRYCERTPHPSLAGYLQEIALDAQEDESEDKKTNKVVLMTLHSAKGLEFPHVYLVGLEDGVLPHERSKDSTKGVQEERRLLYVGVTRARDRLTMTRAETRMKFGRKTPTVPSRFLVELAGKQPWTADQLQEVYRQVRPGTAKSTSKAPRGFTRGRHYKNR